MKISQFAARIGQVFGRTPGTMPALHGLAVCSLVAMAGFAPAANAVVVVSPAANVTVPTTSAGIYINVVTGATGLTAASNVGWDINPWGTGSAFIWGATPGGVVSSPNSPVASLTTGTVVGASSTFVTSPGASTFGSAAGQWTLNATNYFGFSFIGEDAALHYGYGTMIVGGTALVRTVGQLYYESVANTSITVSAVPEPSSVAMLLAGSAALGAMALRRRRENER